MEERIPYELFPPPSRSRSIWGKLIRVIIALAFAVTVMAVAVSQPTSTTFSGVYLHRASPVRLQEIVTALAKGPSFRDAAHPADLAKVADFLQKELTRFTARVKVQEFDADGHRYRNIYGAFGPETGTMTIIGAHYDTAGPNPGADDNASGVAGVLELARLFSEAPPARRIVLALYSLEEPPYFRSKHMGSAHHVRALLKEKAEVRLMISLEMIGFFSDAPGSQQYPAPGLELIYPNAGNFIGLVSTPENMLVTRAMKRQMTLATPLPVYSINAIRELPGIDFSDHLNFLDAGYAAVMVTDTAMNRNMAYHTDQDLPERLDYKRMAMVVDAVYQSVSSLAAPKN